MNKIILVNKNGKWVRKNFRDLKAGDVFKSIVPNETLSDDGWTMARATSAVYMHEGQRTVMAEKVQ